VTRACLIRVFVVNFFPLLLFPFNFPPGMGLVVS
jgi:hypothetical protein